MKKIMEKLMVRFGGSIVSLALVLTALNVNSTCRIWNFQPKMPKGAEKLSKFK